MRVKQKTFEIDIKIKRYEFSYPDDPFEEPKRFLKETTENLELSLTEAIQFLVRYLK